VVGNGPDKPVADNGSDEGRAKNRRTDFEVIPRS
jgi:outer membrane protein OmpA-like peptidoglycan-associated protein